MDKHVAAAIFVGGPAIIVWALWSAFVIFQLTY